MLKISEQEMEGQHAKYAAIIKHAPHHLPSLLSNETRFPEFETDLDNRAQEPWKS